MEKFIARQPVFDSQRVVYGYEPRFRPGTGNFFPDAILDMKIEDVLQGIPIRSEIRDALLGESNDLRGIYDVAVRYEREEWEEIERAAVRVGISAGAMSDLYVRSMGNGERLFWRERK